MLSDVCETEAVYSGTGVHCRGEEDTEVILSKAEYEQYIIAGFHGLNPQKYKE